jgi:hypothetical protein
LALFPSGSFVSSIVRAIISTATLKRVGDSIVLENLLVNLAVFLLLGEWLGALLIGFKGIVVHSVFVT